jgi:hypothetical protein
VSDANSISIKFFMLFQFMFYIHDNKSSLDISEACYYAVKEKSEDFRLLFVRNHLEKGRWVLHPQPAMRGGPTPTATINRAGVQS